MSTGDRRVASAICERHVRASSGGAVGAWGYTVILCVEGSAIMWKTITEGKPLTRLVLFLAIVLIQVVTLPLVGAAPFLQAVHAAIFLPCLFFFISFVI